MILIVSNGDLSPDGEKSPSGLCYKELRSEWIIQPFDDDPQINAVQSDSRFDDIETLIAAQPDVFPTRVGMNRPHRQNLNLLTRVPHVNGDEPGWHRHCR